MKKSDRLEKMESLQNLLISAATGGESDGAQYKVLRSELMNDPFLKDKTPGFVRTCFDLNQFWNFIQHRFGTYRERREFIWNEFNPILEMAETNDKDDPKSIFISHSSKDKFWVRALAERLKGYGVKVWLDEAEINIGDSLTKKIGEAIESTDYVGVVLSHNSVDSPWVQRELQIASQKEINGKKVVVLPILIENVEMPAFLKDKLYADFTDSSKFDSGLSKLLKALEVPVVKEVEVVETKPTGLPQEAPAQLALRKGELATFEDIRIVTLDVAKSHKPDPSKSLYNMYLKLSSLPPSEWRQIFDAERRFPRHAMWRDAWIEGDYIVVHCVPDEIEKYHGNDIGIDVRNTNLKYRQYLMEEAQKEAEKIEQPASERRKLEELKRRLKFD